MNTRIYTRRISRTTIVYRNQYLTVYYCIFCYSSHTWTRKDAPYSCSTYTVIYRILFQTYKILHLPVLRPNTGKYGTENTRIHDNFKQWTKILKIIPIYWIQWIPVNRDYFEYKTLRGKCPYLEFFWSVFSCIPTVRM